MNQVKERPMAKTSKKVEYANKLLQKTTDWINYPLSDHNCVYSVYTSSFEQNGRTQTLIEVGPSLIDTQWLRRDGNFLELVDTGNGYDITFTSTNKTITLDYSEAAELKLALHQVDDKLKYAEVVLKKPE